MKPLILALFFCLVVVQAAMAAPADQLVLLATAPGDSPRQAVQAALDKANGIAYKQHLVIKSFAVTVTPGGDPIGWTDSIPGTPIYPKWEAQVSCSFNGAMPPTVLGLLLEKTNP